MDIHGAQLDTDEDPSVHEFGAELTTPGPQNIYGQHNTILQYDQVPALGLDGYKLYASPRPVPEELMREPSGTSIVAPSSVLDEENGRTYAVHETGRYFLPNDAVCLLFDGLQTRPGS